MKKGEIYEGTVNRILFPNKGEVLLDEGVVYVKNALPGQKIRFSVTKLQKPEKISRNSRAADVTGYAGRAGGDREKEKISREDMQKLEALEDKGGSSRLNED